MDINGKMWRQSPCHLYLIEIPQGLPVQPKRSSKLVCIKKNTKVWWEWSTLVSHLLTYLFMPTQYKLEL